MYIPSKFQEFTYKYNLHSLHGSLNSTDYSCWVKKKLSADIWSLVIQQV